MRFFFFWLTVLYLSLVAQNNPVNNVDGGYNCVYGSLATPGYYTYANPWATGHAVNHTFAPFVDSNPSHFTESTFAAGAAYDDGIGSSNCAYSLHPGSIGSSRTCGRVHRRWLPVSRSFTFHSEFSCGWRYRQWLPRPLSCQ